MRIFEILLRNIIEKKQGPMFHVKHWPLLVLLTIISSSAIIQHVVAEIVSGVLP